MNRQRLATALSVLLLLCLSLLSPASNALSRAEGQSEGNRQFTAYIHSLQSADGHLLLAADEIIWYEGAAADRIFREREPESAAELGGTPDGYYIVDDSEVLSDLPVADNAAVTMQIFDHTGNIADLDIHWNENISLTQFAGQFAKHDVVDLSQFPYHLTVKNGKVVSIVQQYIP